MALAVAQLLAALEDADCEVRCAAVSALASGAVAGDPAAVQLLATRASKDKDEDVREAVASGLKRLAERGDEVATSSLLHLLKDGMVDVRKAAARAAAAVFQAADRTSVSALIAILRDDPDEDVRDAASDALTALSKASGVQESKQGIFVEAVLALLTDGSAESRRAGLQTLSCIASLDSDDILFAVLSLLDDVDASTRCSAAQCLNALCRPAASGNVAVAKVEDELRRRLKNKVAESEPEVRVEFLNVFGDVAAKGIGNPSMVGDDDDNNSSSTKHSACQSNNNVNVAAVVSFLDDDDDDVRSAAIKALRKLAKVPFDNDIVEAVWRFLGTAQDAERRFTALIAAEIIAAGMGDGVEADRLRQHLKDPDEDVRRVAVRALGLVAQSHRYPKKNESEGSPIKSKSLAAALEVLRTDSDEDVRSAAADAVGLLCPLGDLESAALQDLKSVALQDEDRDVRIAAMSALATIASKELPGSAKLQMTEELSQDLAEVFQVSLKDDEESVRESAIEALFTMRPRYPESVFRLLEGSLNHDSSDVRCSALRGISRLVKAGGCKVPTAAAELLEDSDELVREEACDALVAVAEEFHLVHTDFCVSFLDLSAAKCDHKEPAVRSAALEATVRMTRAFRKKSSGREKEVADLFLKAHQDTAAEVQQTAVRVASVLPLRSNQKLAAELLQACAHRMEHSDRSAQKAAAAVIGLAWPEGNPELAAQARLRLSNPNGDVRRAALECLAAAAVARGCGCSEDSDTEDHAQHTDSDAERHDDEEQGLASSEEAVLNALAAAAERIEDDVHHVRKAAVSALRRLTSRLAEPSVSSTPSLQELLRLSRPPSAKDLSAADRRKRLREAAFEAVRPRLEHGCPAVRGVAADAIAVVVPQGHTEGESALLELLARSKNASNSNSALLRQGDDGGYPKQPAVDVVFTSSHNEDDEDVHWSVLKALVHVAARGSRSTVEAAIQSCNNQDEQIRIAAVQLLAKTAEPGDKTVLVSLEACATDQASLEASREATRALLSLFPDWGKER
eukprot:TRINITY_DN9197_c0_g3_i1.p1 TRINITY_DN9197_c0_g3~~TRINITY_DN9197_c0_g3_i1.p1  ORF type:complete len:1035 (+),score=263.38 TRINITY_DN9197_c0_g3_i1:33-3107(+)